MRFFKRLGYRLGLNDSLFIGGNSTYEMAFLNRRHTQIQTKQNFIIIIFTALILLLTVFLVILTVYLIYITQSQPPVTPPPSQHP